MSEPPGPQRYQLSAPENERRFREQIVPTYLTNKPTREHPLAAVLVGQPGAGKTRAGKVIGDCLGGPTAYVALDSDLFTPFHPDYARLLRTDDRLMTAATRADGREWLAKAQRYAQTHRFDTLIDHTVDDLDYFETSLRSYHGAGYRVVVFVLAVPEALSRQGIIHRYHEQPKHAGGGRLTIAAKAAASYRGILHGADLIDQHQLAHVVGVFRRGFTGGSTYLNTLTATGTWKHPPGLRQAIARERDQPLPIGERTSFLEVQQQLYRELPAGFLPELRTIDTLAQPLLISRINSLTSPSTGPTPDQVIAHARPTAPPPPHRGHGR
ncbi:MAG: zeta toxin family protein [Pseudonocardiaceae bacterium]